MKILMVNKFFYIKGGSETYYFSLKKLLELNGHEVIDFSMKDDKNFDSKYSEYFVNHIDYNLKQDFIDKVKYAIKIIYSLEAKRKIEKLIIETRPDIVHLHLFQHQISSSILDVFEKYSIPVIYTAHDLKMLCPNYKMLSSGLICERCKNSKYYNCIKGKCVKDSYLKSTVSTVEAYIDKIRNTKDKISMIITPSAFYRKKFIEYGFCEEKVFHIRNFLFETESFEIEQSKNEDYFLYFGRLSEEKGVRTLIDSLKGLKNKLIIVGDGPLKKELVHYAEVNKINNVCFLGYKSGKELSDIVKYCKAVIVPSEWYENGPYSIIEALAMGKMIIGSKIAGITELVIDEYNGYHFIPGDVQSLENALMKCNKLTESELLQMSKNSRSLFEAAYGSEKHYQEIIRIYNKAIGVRK